MMKKVTLSLVVLMMTGFFMIPVKKADAQVGFGLKVGASFSNLALDGMSANETPSTDMLLGVEGGVYANIPIG
ncbi:MAG TPA: hypothetical protein VK084_05365, partial [Chitinophagaceae bacterium]|nr:hypothetical protein [Chitinophagaceae bacterium]